MACARNRDWVALAEAKSARYDFHNASISGGPAPAGMQPDRRRTGGTKPDIVVIEPGANDGLRWPAAHATGLNLGWMIGSSKAAGARVLLVGLQLPPNFGRYASDFQRSYALIAQRPRYRAGAAFPGAAGHAAQMVPGRQPCTRWPRRNLLADQMLRALDALPALSQAVPRSPRDRAPADVVAVEFAVPMDRVDAGIGIALRIGHAVAQRGHARLHATAGGDDLAGIVQRGAGMEDLGVRGHGIEAESHRR